MNRKHENNVRDVSRTGRQEIDRERSTASMTGMFRDVKDRQE